MVTEISHNLLNHQMLKRMPEIGSSRLQVLAAEEIIRNAKVEIVKTWSLSDVPFHFPCIGRYKITDKGLFEYGEIFLHSF